MRTIRLFLISLLCLVGLVLYPAPVHAAPDHYVTEFLKATGPVQISLNEQGETKQFTPEQLAEGKELFKDSCINCHVGGATLPNPAVSLSLKALDGATPPRSNLDGFVAYMREPMTYDGSDINFLCRQVTENWLPRAELEKLGAFVLRAAEVAPSWGRETFDEDS